MVEARDGAKVPVSIVYKKGTEMNGENPLLLYATVQAWILVFLAQG